MGNIVQRRTNRLQCFRPLARSNPVATERDGAPEPRSSVIMHPISSKGLIRLEDACLS